MKNKIYLYKALLLIITLFFGFYILGYNSHKPKTIVKTVKCIVPKIVYRTKKNVILDITYETLDKDLVTNYNFLSKNQQIEILSSIKKASKAYNINPLVLYSLISVESSFRWYCVSPKRLIINSEGKKQYDRALGLMSVIWAIHKKALIKNKIITKKSELREIKGNIKAGSFILANMIKKYKGLDNAIKHYFGISPYTKIYLKKIQQKVGALVWSKVE